ncbi:Pyrimidine-specific ribonucleoside hydrolase RihA [Roseivivax jejudonensis]|uniref:Pyrimidine-specific ribonucleoside hydrolase RihA n=1 Tax=Roseivivax jejudonensis TaxID=1529041 RepID=A0A1X7A5B3_9RHOB|nr:nucleoside hydrolase [Roseivivax jejudonensis]SLN70752.1 Pyrimidine-specific ribonucleoside hydrolase RihA [Roseivivax jejudonensis]
MAEGTLWVDTDMGFDDLAALCLLDAAGMPVGGVSLVAGNVALEQVRRNAHGARAAFGWRWPVHDGAAAPLAGRTETAVAILGSMGMRSAGRHLPTVESTASPVSATEAIASWIGEGGRRILALGPLTNLAHLVEAYPVAAERVEIVWMGGSAGPGNHTAAAEFNAFADPEALARLIACGVSLSMVGLDVCRQVQVSHADAVRMRGNGPRAELLADLLEGYVNIAGTGRMALYDPVAAAFCVAHDCVKFAPARLDVELNGTLTRGMTVIEWRAHRAAPNARIATQADASRIRDLFRRGFDAAIKAEGVRP